MPKAKRHRKRPRVSPDSLFPTVRASAEDQRWMVFHWARQRLLEVLSGKLNRVSWEAAASEKLFDSLQEELLAEWRRTRRHYQDREELEKCLIGALYEALFYKSWLGYAADCWDVLRRQDAGDPEYKWAEVFTLQMVPITEPIPRMFRGRLPDDLGKAVPALIKAELDDLYGRESRWGPEVLPQTRADFLLIFDDGKKMRWPLSLFDVKSSRNAFEDSRKTLRSHALAAWLSQNYYYAAYPKTGPDYPRQIEDWEMGQICLKCGDLCEPSFEDGFVIELRCRECQALMPDRYGFQVCLQCGDRYQLSVEPGETVIQRCRCQTIERQGLDVIATIYAQDRFGPVERIRALHEWGLRL